MQTRPPEHRRMPRALAVAWARLCPHGWALLLLSATSLCFSLLREHSIDGTGWAPTRTLKVGCDAVVCSPALGLSLRDQPPVGAVVSCLSQAHQWPRTHSSLLPHRPPALLGLLSQALGPLTSSGRAVSHGHLLSPLPAPQVLSPFSSGRAVSQGHLLSPLAFTTCASTHLQFLVFSFSSPTPSLLLLSHP